MAKVYAVNISGSTESLKFPTKLNSMSFWTQNNDYTLMRDYIIGACSYFNYPSPWMLGVGIMEEGTPGKNWMQLTVGDLYDSFISDFWNFNNKTEESVPTLAELEVIEALNAVAGTCWMTKQSRYGKSGWEALGMLAGGYNTWKFADPGSGLTAYAWSTLFLAYGSKYTDVTYRTYQGAQYSAKGTGLPSSGLVKVYSSQPDTTYGEMIDVPTWTMVPKTLSYFGGKNPNGKQIILFANGGMDYVSALNIVLYFKRKRIMYDGVITYPLVTSDADFAASNAKGTRNACVIAVGNNSYITLKNKGLTAYSSYPNLKFPGFIGGTATGKTAYTDARTAAVAANNAGF